MTVNRTVPELLAMMDEVARGLIDGETVLVARWHRERGRYPSWSWVFATTTNDGRQALAVEVGDILPSWVPDDCARSLHGLNAAPVDA